MIYREHKTDLMQSGATYSPCEQYRYTLWRKWGVGQWCNYLCLNPSVATEAISDPTVTRLERRARNDGYAGLIVTNIFAYRATDPRDMKAQADPVGPENDEAILTAAEQSAIVVCAWGQHGRHLGRSDAVLTLLKRAYREKLHALKIGHDGMPHHPLYIAYSYRPQVMV